MCSQVYQFKQQCTSNMTGWMDRWLGLYDTLMACYTEVQQDQMQEEYVEVYSNCVLRVNIRDILDTD